MADAAVTFLLENLGQLLKHHVSLIGGVDRELDLLKKDLESLSTFLRKYSKIPNKPEGFRELERRIRDVVYEAEDTIDSCIAAAYNKHSLFSGFGEQVRSLREREVINMVEKVQSFEATTMANIPQPKSPTKPKLQIIREENVLEFQDHESIIVGYLQESKEELDVISIIGMPGLGKTTLAQKIFRSDFVKHEFPNRIWVNVIQALNIRNVLLNILKEFTSDDVSGLSDLELMETVEYYLKERKFLLVLDDVTMDAWNDIRKVLSKSNNMSKVLITSCEKSVGDKATQSYELLLLTGPQSWELLQYQVFGILGKCPDDLKVVGECIAKNCHGFPLSVMLIAGILVEEDDENISVIKEDWLKVSKFLKNDKKKQVSDIIELSYNRLPDELKDCFLYFAVFSKDYEISVWKLIRLWIAEGFIQGKSMEENAEEYLNDLIRRNLVMVVKRNSKGEVKICRVHDVVHAFCVSKVLQEQQRFFHELKCVNGDFVPPVSKIGKPRRICFHSDLETFLTSNEKKHVDRIRSLLFLYKTPVDFPTKYSAVMVDGLDLLRVLESEFNRLDHIPKGVNKLFHLRYLTISVDTLTTLSHMFSDLWNLQTVVVYTKNESITIKANIWKMIQLRHLKINVVITEITQGDGEGCRALQTLSRISTEICTTNFFKKAPNLKRLGIQGKLASLFQTNSLGRLNQLEKLKLVNTYHSEAQQSMRFPQLRSWFPAKLKMLTIVGTRLDWNHVSKLGMIETLEALKLKDNAFTGNLWEAVGGGFHSLHFLLIEDTELIIWEVSNDSFPKLRHLVLRKCKKLKEIPDDVVGSLEKLDIEDLSASGVESAKKIDDNKIADQGQEGASRFKLTILNQFEGIMK